MNIKPELKITLWFENMKSVIDFKINYYLKKYNLLIQEARSYRDTNIYFTSYTLAGEPEMLIKFLKDSEIRAKMF